MSFNFAFFYILDRLQLPRRLFDFSRRQVLKARNNSTTAWRGLVCLPTRKYCRHVFRRSLYAAQTAHIVRRRIFDKRLHGGKRLHCDVVVNRNTHNYKWQLGLTFITRAALWYRPRRYRDPQYCSDRMACV